MQGGATSRAIDAVMTHTLESGWATPLCDMSAWPGGRPRCLYVHFCWPCAAGDVAVRVGRSYWWDCVCGGFLGIATCTNGLCWGVTRTHLREQHKIPGLELLDIAVTSLFPCCYLAQALNHLQVMDMRQSGAAPLPVALPVAAPTQRAMPASYQAPTLVVRY